MGKPISNGLIEVHDSNEKEHGFFCMKLVQFIGKEAKLATPEYTELWEKAFASAKRGVCLYKNRCSIYKRTAKDLVNSNYSLKAKENEQHKDF